MRGVWAGQVVSRLAAASRVAPSLLEPARRCGGGLFLDGASAPSVLRPHQLCRSTMAPQRVVDGLMKRHVPSEVSLSRSWRETVDTEDWLRGQQWLREQKKKSQIIQPPPAGARTPQRDELLGFAKSQKGGGWADALDDPEVLEAMKVVKARVAKIAEESREYGAPDPSSYALRVLNAREGGPRHKLLRTSTTHPLYLGQIAWNPELRAWPGRTIPDRKIENTSIWCSSWGAGASDQAVDLEFKHPARVPLPASAKDLHTRGWR